MELPDWVEKHKTTGYEVKKIGNGYYLYRMKSRWDKNKKKSVKAAGEYIGVIKPEGLIRRKERIDMGKPVFSLEYGATAFILSISEDILVSLKEVFPAKMAEEIYAVSILRLISPCPFRRVGDHYQTSWLSQHYPGLRLSKTSITKLIDDVGNDRRSCAAFMRNTMQPAPYMLVDGSRVTSKSEGMMRALPGHDKNKKFLPQLNQIYIASVSEAGDTMPIFYRNVAGNMPDIIAFERTMEDAGIENAIILADTGFASGCNFSELEDPDHNLKYIVPLKRDTKGVNLEKVTLKEHFTYNGRLISGQSMIHDGYRICVFRDTKMAAKELYDLVGRIEKANDSAMHRKSFNPDTDLRNASTEVAANEKESGIIIFRTNLMDNPTSYIYLTYKIRWDIELLFKTLRDTCEQDCSYMRDDIGFEAWSFFSHISIMIACRILAILRKLDLLKEYSLEGLLDYLSRIHTVQIANQWRIAETTKKTRDLVESLGFVMSLE